MLYVFIETIIFAIQLQVMQVTISNCVNLISNKKKKRRNEVKEITSLHHERKKSSFYWLIKLIMLNS